MSKPPPDGDNKQAQIKSVIFIPHTKNSELTRELKMKEAEMFKITGDKIKIVEKAGTKLENILTSGDLWKVADCERDNCFLCTTKQLNGKHNNRDCTKRNIS